MASQATQDTSVDAMQAIIDRALGDPDFADRFRADPAATAAAYGLPLPNTLKEELLDILGADGPISEPLRQRVSMSMNNHTNAW